MSKQRDTHELEVEGVDAPIPEHEAPQPKIIAPGDIHLELGRGANRIRIPLHFDEADELVVGRGDDENPVALDMTPYGAFDCGVSRRHAILTLRREGMYVQDLGSTNGTRINGFSLVPERNYRLRNTDEIEIGRLRIIVRLSS